MSDRRRREVLDLRDGLAGWTPLHAAAVGVHVEALRVLLAFGADPRLPDALGETALQCLGRGTQIRREEARKLLAPRSDAQEEKQGAGAKDAESKVDESKDAGVQDAVGKAERMLPAPNQALVQDANSDKDDDYDDDPFDDDRVVARLMAVDRQQYEEALRDLK